MDYSVNLFLGGGGGEGGFRTQGESVFTYVVRLVILIFPGMNPSSQKLLHVLTFHLFIYLFIY